MSPGATQHLHYMALIDQTRFQSISSSTLWNAHLLPYFPAYMIGVTEVLNENSTVPQIPIIDDYYV